MLFETTGLYHVYNQGNNRQQVFFYPRNYLFFMDKISKYIKPYADILAWCLMPNHFHLMICVNQMEVPASVIVGVTKSHPDNDEKRTIDLNSSIGIMLRSYTRAINIQEKRSGALFREETKALCLNNGFEMRSPWFVENGSTRFIMEIPDYMYPQICFRYIQANPVRAGLAKSPEEYKYSSARELINSNRHKLVSPERVKEFGLF